MKTIIHFVVGFAVAYGLVYGGGKLFLWAIGELK